MKAPIILRIFKNNQLAEVKQLSQDQIIFGSGTDAQVILKGESVSAIHCLIELRDSGYYLSDLGSTSGTYKNDKPVLDELISSGDQIRIGEYVVHFFVGVPKSKAPDAESVVHSAPIVTSLVNEQKSLPKSGVLKPEIPKTVAPKLPGASITDRSVKEERSSVSKKTRSKNFHTYAPPSHVSDLREYLQLTRGPVVEVLVTWKERILSVHHFKMGQSITLGSSKSCDISVPSGFTPEQLAFADLTSGTKIQLSASMTAEVFQKNKKIEFGTASAIKLDQGELLAIKAADGTMQIFVRHIPEAPVPALAGTEFTANELTGFVVSIIVVALLALYMSVYMSTESLEEKKEDQLHLAQVVFNKKPEEKKPESPPKEVKPVEQKVPPPPQKVEITEKKKDAKGDPNKPEAMKDLPQARASEVRPMPNKNRPKKFTSTKQGGSVKIAQKEGANAQSAKDVTKTGLLAAFGSGGNRSQLDKAYSGSGELLGMADKATGTSGQTTNRAGDDLGSKFKDTGAGGKGTATQGIAGVGTKGRSSGQSAYGNIGVGGKGSVAIDAGGTGAEFVGTVDKAAVRRVILSILNQIQNCYNRALRTNSELEGKVIIHWEVYEQGIVKSSRVQEAPNDLKQVAECVALRIRDQRFPEPPVGSYYEVHYPFVMGNQK